MRGRRNPDKPSTKILPACRVCGEPGTGLHYGVNTCTACKGFFRRSSYRSDNYLCMRNRLCLVGPRTKRRQSCPKCRYDKCIAVGMSKEACKIGRYTMEKKASDWNEVMGASNAQASWVGGILPQSTHNPQICELETSPGYGTAVLPLSEKSDSQKGVSEFKVFTDTRTRETGHGDPDTLQTYNTLSYPKINEDIPGFARPWSGAVDGTRSDNYDSFVDQNAYSEPIRGQDIRDITSCVSDVTNQNWGSYCTTTTVTALEGTLQTPKYSVSIHPFLSSSDQTLGQELNQLQSIIFPKKPSYNDSKQITGPEIRAADSVNQIHLPQNFTDFRSTNENRDTPMFNVVSNKILYSEENVKNPAESDEDSSPNIVRNQVTEEFASCISSPPDITTTHVSNTKQSNANTSQEQSLDIVRHGCPRRSNSNDTKDGQFLRVTNGKPKKGLTLYLVAPDSRPLSMSIFEQFPFKCFERNLLAPLVSQIYIDDDNESLDTDTPHETQDTHVISNVEQSLKHAGTMSDFRPISIDSFTESSGIHVFENDFSYDELEMENLLEYIRHINRRHFGPESTHLPESAIGELVDKFRKICQIQDSLRGNMKFIDDDKYYAILRTTGIDVDKRREWYLTNFGELEANVAKEIKLLRVLPGFKSFGINDRIALVRSASAFVYLTFKNMRTTDLDKDVCIWQNGFAFRMSTAQRVLAGGPISMDEFLIFCRQIKDMDLSYDEIILLKPALIMIPDFCEEELEDLSAVKQWHRVYLCCLLHHLRKTLGPVCGGHRFNKLLGLIQLIKGPARPMKKAMNAMKASILRLTEGLSHQPLLKEVFILDAANKASNEEVSTNK